VPSPPPDGQPGRDNGLLQAWEIFERVRIDADLVTLSACITGMGGEMCGEGILGLTRRSSTPAPAPCWQLLGDWQ
jgi:CHAT domain-containing protein